MAAAIIFAVLSALSSAGSAVLQRFAAVDHKSKAAEAAAAGAAAGQAWRNALNLVRQPMWLLGGACLVGTFIFQALALYFGPLSVVQPILVLELIFTLGLRALLMHDGIARRTWLAALTICVGLAAFLVVASPGPDTRVPNAGQWLLSVGTRPWPCWCCCCSAARARPPAGPPCSARPRPSCGRWTPRSSSRRWTCWRTPASSESSRTGRSTP